MAGHTLKWGSIKKPIMPLVSLNNNQTSEENQATSFLFKRSFGNQGSLKDETFRFGSVKNIDQTIKHISGNLPPEKKLSFKESDINQNRAYLVGGSIKHDRENLSKFMLTELITPKVK